LLNKQKWYSVYFAKKKKIETKQAPRRRKKRVYEKQPSAHPEQVLNSSRKKTQKNPMHIHQSSYWRLALHQAPSSSVRLGHFSRFFIVSNFASYTWSIKYI